MLLEKLEYVPLILTKYVRRGLCTIFRDRSATLVRHAASTQAISNKGLSQPSSSFDAAKIYNHPGPSNIHILSQHNVHPELVILTTSSAIDKELQSIPQMTNNLAVFNPEIIKPLPKVSPKLQTASKGHKRVAVLIDKLTRQKCTC